jgi:LPS-assembly protein
VLRRLGAGRAVWLGLLGLLALIPAAAALEFGEGTVLLFADRLTADSVSNVITAEGNVEVVRGGRTLLADQLRYDQDTDQMEALGNVALVEPTGETLYADRVVLSGDLRNGLAEQLRARLLDGSLAAATEGRLVGPRTEFDRAVYSPCPLCKNGESPPLWQLTARRIEHDQVEKEITYRHAFLELYGVPIFYTPYFAHPDPSVERKSGFLAPSFGTSNELGQFIQTPYYFALAPNYDLTFSPIFTTQEGTVAVAEYRHLLPNGRFELAGSGTYATEAGSNDNANPTEKAFRGHIEGEGRFRLTQDARWGYDLAATTDNTYLQRYKFSNENVLTNRLFAERVWQRNYAAVNAYAFQGLRSFDHQQEIPFALPLAEVELTSQPWRWGSRFTLDSNLLALTRVDGLDTRRFSVGGGWELPWLGELGDQYKLRLSLRGDAYQTDGNPQTFGSNGGENFTGRVLPRMTVDWNWPWVGRDSFGLTPLIEPVASFTWTINDPNDGSIPNEDSQDLEFDDTNLFEPSRFAGIDRVEGGAKVSYGLRFAAADQYGEVVSGLFGQSYRFSGNNDFGPDSGINDDFSDYVGRIEVSPVSWFRARYRFLLDQNDFSPSRNEVGAVVGPRPVRFGVTYLSLKDDPALDSSRSREEITAGVALGLSSSLSLRAQFRRNLEQDRDVWHKFGIVYRHPCLELVAGVQRRNTKNADAEGDTTFSFRVTFTNLGELSADSGLLGSSF